jgi:serine/threonine protein kinase
VELAQTLVPYHHRALPEGSILREWRLERVLGVGGFGIVYRAKGIYFNETVAIKEYFPGAISDRRDGTIITPTDSSSQDVYSLGLEKFVEEAKVLWDLSRPERHPNIVSVRNLFEINGTAYMVMDFEDGAPLSEFINQRRQFDETSLLELLRPIAEGLDRAHAAGVIHRDIKPANIIIRETNEPVLIDFGSARFDSGQATSATVTFHTPPYAALEQYVRTYPQGPWTDVYALGVVLYQCITGQKPPEALERLHGGDGDLLSARDWPGFSRSFTLAVDAAMAILPAERPQSISEWLRLFERPGRDRNDELTRIRNYLATGDATRLHAPRMDLLPGAYNPAPKSSVSGARAGARKPAPHASIGRRWILAGVGLLVVGSLAAGGMLMTFHKQRTQLTKLALPAAPAAKLLVTPSAAVPPQDPAPALNDLIAEANQVGAPPGVLTAVSEARSKIESEFAEIRSLGSQPSDSARATELLAALRGEAATLDTREAATLSSDTHRRAAEAVRTLGDTAAAKTVAADAAVRKACAALTASSESETADPPSLVKMGRAALVEYAAFNRVYADASRLFAPARRAAFSHIESEAEGRAARAIAAARVAKPWFLASQSRKQAYLRLQSDAARAKVLGAQLAQLSQSVATSSDLHLLDRDIFAASGIDRELAGLAGETAAANGDGNKPESH